MYQIIKNIFILTLSLGLLSIISILAVLWAFSNNLPDYKFLKSYKPPVSSKVYSGDGELVNDFSSEKRIFVPYNAISDKIINSFLSAEDKNFYSHPGVDAKGVLRAIVNNISNIASSKRLEGASTITQQVAKNFLLTNEVSLNRKIKEAILAFRIERALSKERILELYLNQIYLGGGAYGVASASLEYFDKSISELNYDEAALLAALPKAPSRYNPYKNIELATFRRNLVLKNLFENNYINKIKYEKFINKKIILKKRKKTFTEDTSYYVEDIRKDVVDQLGFDKVYKQGLNISTPIDLDLQKIAIRALRGGLISYDKRKGWRGPLLRAKKINNWKEKIDKFKLEKSINWDLAIIKKINKFSVEIETENKLNGVIKYENISWIKKEFNEILKIGDIIYVENINSNIFSLRQLPEVNGGIVVMDPFTGRVLALSGGFSFKKSEFNRATQAKRQPGSAFKPFVYATALENNFSPNSIVLDAPYIAEQGIGLKDWKPENYGKEFYGPTTLRKGLEYSRNLMTVRIAQEVGLNKILQLSKELNIYNEIPELLSVSLGSAETTLFQITNAYATFINGGKKIKPILIERIQDRRGKTIFNSDNRTCVGCDRYSESENIIPYIKDDFQQIISKETAYQILSMLEGTIQRGTGKRLRDINVPLAGKTGTTNDNYDAWFIGSTSNLVIGVYIGFDKPKTLGKYETGAKAALPIFKSFIQEALYKDDFKPFLIPKEILFTAIDYNTGKKENFSNPDSIVEAFKQSDINRIKNNNFGTNTNYDSLIKFRQFY